MDPKDKDSGYFSKIGMRVIDNLQVTVNSVHFRFENTLSKSDNFSVGITLNKFEIFTTNEKWEKKFLDRTKSEFRSAVYFNFIIIILSQCINY